MRGAILPFLQYAFMALCLVKAQGQLYTFVGRRKLLNIKRKWINFRLLNFLIHRHESIKMSNEFL